MQADRERRKLRILDEALALQGAAREAFLLERCGDDQALRRELEAMLADASLGWTAQVERELSEARRDRDDGAGLLPGPGDMVGDYTLGALLGRGGMGVVYAAVQEYPQREVALKLMHPRFLGSGRERRFEFETESLARLSHPHVASILQAGLHDLGGGLSLPWIAMELVRGAREITTACHDEGLPLARRLALFRDVCDAIHHGHQNGIIHRDVKPGNVLLDADGQVKVIDFGVALPARLDDAASRLSSPGELVGTVAYMSPEQASGEGCTIDTRSDVYSLGVLLFELISGELPIDLTDLRFAESLSAIVMRPPRRLADCGVGAPRALERVVARALAKDRRDRYASASGLSEDVGRFLRDEPVQAGSTGAVERALLAVRRYPVTSGLLCLLVLGSLGFAWFAREKAATERADAVELQRRAEQLRRATANALDSAAEAAAQKGDWEGLLVLLERRRELPVERSLSLDLAQLRALLAAGDGPGAWAALEALDEVAGPGQAVAERMLARALLTLLDPEEHDDGWPLLETALQLGLPEADAAYVEGLLARDADSAIASLQQALALDPAHALAPMSLLTAHFAALHVREGQELASALALRLPRDRSVHAMSVLFAHLGRDDVRLSRAVAVARTVLTDSEIEALTVVGDVVRDLASMTSGVAFELVSPVSVIARVGMGVLRVKANTALLEPLFLGDSFVQLRFGSTLFAAIQRLFGALLPPDLPRLSAALDDVLAVNPAPALLMLRGMLDLIALDADPRQVIAVMERARPGLEPAFPELLAFTDLALLHTRVLAGELGDVEQRDRALRDGLQAAADGTLPGGLIAGLVDLALAAESFESARYYLAAWRAREPDSSEWLELEALVDAKQGHHASMIRKLGVLAQRPGLDPDDRELFQQDRAKALDILQQEMATWTADGGSGP